MTAAGAPFLRLKDWFIQDALPLWAEVAWDEARGGFYESLDFNAAPVTGQPRRVRVQARQIYTFSQAGVYGWSKDAEAIASKGFDYFLDHACPDGGLRGCVHQLSGDGEVLDDRRDLYDQAFLLLACAARWKAAKDDRALKLANATLSFLDEDLASPHGGWLESDRRELPRRQNPHMHLFEAFMALYDATGESRYFECANRIVKDCIPRFFDQDEGVLREYFTETLNADPAHAEIEPGHMFEWVWLLRKYERLGGADFSGLRKQLYTRGVQFGEDPKFFGFVSNSVDINNPKNQNAKRLWPQTEYLKASCVQASRGDSHAHNTALSLTNALFSTYLDVDKKGLWIDEFDKHGAPISKDVPASILYHLFEAALETAQYAETVKGQ